MNDHVRTPIGRRCESPGFGFALSSEENGPRELIQQARRAEQAGLDSVSVSDHFHPWLPAQGNSPFAWSVLGGIAAVTERIVVGTGVTCPLLRMHPVVVAQAAATMAVMLPGRFFLGLGSGEALNEAVVGARWPSAAERLERLREAITIIRELWSGDVVNHDGTYYTVSDGRLFTVPAAPPPLFVAAAAPEAAEIAGEQDGLVGTAPDDELLVAYERHGGEGKPRLAQITICWDHSEAEARRIARKYWATTLLNWDVRSATLSPAMFENMTASAREEEVAENVLCGPDLTAIANKAGEYWDAGFDHLYVHQVGPRQLDFLDVYERELLPALRARPWTVQGRGKAAAPRSA